MQFHLRQFAALILFLALPLALFSYGFRLGSIVGEVYEILGLFLLSPCLLVFAILFLPAAPARNLIAAGLRQACVLVILMPSFLSLISVGGFHIFTYIPIIAMTLIFVSDMVGPFLAGRCPACHRYGLISGGGSGGRSPWSEPQPRARYRYRWCLRCRARLKARRIRMGKYAGWEDASSSIDDRYYWLWTSRFSR
jgi:hypothetical protein